VESAHRIAVRADVLEVELSGSRVVYDLRSRRAHVLNPTAATIWGALKEQASPAEVIERLTRSGIAATSLEADVEHTIEQFREQGLLDGSSSIAASAADHDRTVPAPFTRVDDGATPSQQSMPFSLLGPSVAIATDDPTLIEDIDWYTQPLRVEGAGEEVWWAEGGVGVTRTIPARLNRLATLTSSVTVVHAAGVVRDGIAVVLPGDPGAGKSTLAASLLRRGFGYLSDEAVGLRADDQAVLGYPKRLALDLGSWSLFDGLREPAAVWAREAFDPTRVRWVDPRDLNESALDWRAIDAPRLGVGIFASYEKGAPLTVERLEPVDALVALLRTSFNLHLMADAGLVTLRDVASSVPFYRVRHGGIEQIAPAIDELIGSDAVGGVW
jgi:hypothetical protein